MEILVSRSYSLMTCLNGMGGRGIYVQLLYIHGSFSSILHAILVFGNFVDQDFICYLEVLELEHRDLINATERQ